MISTAGLLVVTPRMVVAEPDFELFIRGCSVSQERALRSLAAEINIVLPIGNAKTCIEKGCQSSSFHCFSCAVLEPSAQNRLGTVINNLLNLSDKKQVTKKYLSKDGIEVKYLIASDLLLGEPVGSGLYLVTQPLWRTGCVLSHF